MAEGTPADALARGGRAEKQTENATYSRVSAPRRYDDEARQHDYDVCRKQHFARQANLYV